MYEATVRIGDSTKTSTFFPKEWTPEEVLSVIEDAYNYRRKVPDTYNTYEYIDKVSGIKINMYIDEKTQTIRSIFPVLE